jgi:hypothetical protein
VLTGHGFHRLPFREALLQLVAFVEDDIELLWWLELSAKSASMTYPFVLPQVAILVEAWRQCYPRRDDTEGGLGEEVLDISAFMREPPCPPSTYLDDLVDLGVLPLVWFGQLLATGGHVVVPFLGPSVAVRGRVKVGVAL